MQGPDPAEANTNQIQWNLLHTDSVTYSHACVYSVRLLVKRSGFQP